MLKQLLFQTWYRSYSAALRLFHAYFPRTVPLEKGNARIGLASMFQNEARFLKEWIEFHRLVGVSRFLLYDNDSQDDPLSVLQPYIDSGLVSYTRWPSDNHSEREATRKQVHAYRDATRRLRGEVDWLALIDVDEFLFPVQTSSIQEALAPFASQAAVSVSWQQFGTSNIERLDPTRPMLEQLIRKAPTTWEENRLVKTIVRPEYVAQCYSSHFCHMRWGYLQSDERGNLFQGVDVPVPSADRLCINHYWTRDEAFMREVKGKRKDGLAQTLYEERKEILNTQEDTRIFRFLPPLQQRLGMIHEKTTTPC